MKSGLCFFLCQPSYSRYGHPASAVIRHYAHSKIDEKSSQEQKGTGYIKILEHDSLMFSNLIVKLRLDRHRTVNVNSTNCMMKSVTHKPIKHEYIADT